MQRETLPGKALSFAPHELNPFVPYQTKSAKLRALVGDLSLSDSRTDADPISHRYAGQRDGAVIVKIRARLVSLSAIVSSALVHNKWSLFGRAAPTAACLAFGPNHDAFLDGLSVRSLLLLAP